MVFLDVKFYKTTFFPTLEYAIKPQRLLVYLEYAIKPQRLLVYKIRGRSVVSQNEIRRFLK